MGAPVRLQHRVSRATTNDPTDIQEIWMNKHCGLQLASVCNKVWAKRLVLQCSGIKSTELVMFRYFLTGKDLQVTSSWRQSQLVTVAAHLVFFSYMCFFRGGVLGHWSDSSVPDGEFPYRRSSQETVKPLLNHFKDTKSKTLSMPLSEKIELFFQETKEVKMLFFSFVLA